MTKRPLSITIIAILSILLGVGTLLLASFFALLADSSHINDPFGRFHWMDLLLLAFALIPGVGGVLLLKRRSRGRWLVMAWLILYVVINHQHPPIQLVLHGLVVLAFGYFLFRPKATAYFKG